MGLDRNPSPVPPKALHHWCFTLAAIIPVLWFGYLLSAVSRGLLTPNGLVGPTLAILPLSVLALAAGIIMRRRWLRRRQDHLAHQQMMRGLTPLDL
jgi:hypothetical protein